MTKNLHIIVWLCLTLSLNAFAIKGGNCWDPSTWGHICNEKAEVVSLLPIEFLNEAKVRNNLVALYASDSHVEGHLLTVKKITTDEKTTYIVTLQKIAMPPSPAVRSHFTISRTLVDGHPQIEVSDIVHGGCECLHS